MSSPTATPPDRPERTFPGLPMLGNAEFLVYLAAAVLAAVAAWLGDDTGVGHWLDFFKWATAAYLISRGIAKASRVFEY
jgi:hypothetical protein